MSDVYTQTAPTKHLPQDDAPLDLHKVYCMHSDCGYTRAVKLQAHEARNVAGRLRAIHAVTGVLMTDNGTDASLGNYLRSGLVEAVHLLAYDSLLELEQANERPTKVSQNAKGARSHA